MTRLDLQTPHRRRNPLTGEWVLVSPHRSQRPWQGRQDAPDRSERPAYDATCYLCPGNARAGGARNPAYTGTFVFNNDFAALLPRATLAPDAQEDDPLFAAQAVHGQSRVICFSPDHSKTLADLGAPELRAVIDAWAEQSAALGRTHRWVQVFENKGELMGCSNPHPHGQVWATSYLPREAVREDHHQRVYHATHGRALLLDVAAEEARRGERVLVASADWLVIVPWWATWPFETLVLPRRPVARLPELDAAQRDDLALALRHLLRAYDALFDCRFPYSMGWHGAPFESVGDSGATPDAAWQLHAHFYPPLLRSASVRKFMVGFEMLAEAQRDLSPEQAAAALRAAAARANGGSP